MAHPIDSGTTARLLVVADENAGRCAELARLLEAAGFQVRLARDPAELRGAVADGQHALVLLEPDFCGAGLELLRELSGGTEPGAPLLALVGRDELDRLEALCAAGADDVVELPLHGAQLEHRVRAAIRQAELLAGLEAGAGIEKGAGSESGVEPPAVSAMFEGGTRTALLERFLGELAGACSRAGAIEQKLAVFCVRAGTEDAEEDASAQARLLSSLRRVLAELERETPERDLDGALVTGDHGEGARALFFVPMLVRVQDAARLGGRIREALLGPDGGFLAVDIGVAVFPTDGEDACQLVDNARAAAESAKQEGRSELRFHNEAMNRWSFERLALEQGLRDAVERGELVVHYQPKLDLATCKVVGVEALVRWEHPRLGTISPVQFIPLAEETGLIVPIGEFVLRTSCIQNRSWQHQGLPPVRMAVNLSPVQFRRPDLPQVVRDVLSETGMDPSWLELELTESMLMEQARSISARLMELKQEGIQLSIDDFGTGYSSLSYLRRFPIDTLKIDRSFVRDVTSNADDAAIVTSIILMGKSLKLAVIAEGVETESQRAFLEVLGCDEIQGYLISPPIPGEAMGRFLRDWNGR